MRPTRIRRTVPIPGRAGRRTGRSEGWGQSSFWSWLAGCTVLLIFSLFLYEISWNVVTLALLSAGHDPTNAHWTHFNFCCGFLSRRTQNESLCLYVSICPIELLLPWHFFEQRAVWISVWMFDQFGYSYGAHLVMCYYVTWANDSDMVIKPNILLMLLLFLQ